MGMRKMAISVLICMAALENHSPFSLRQWPGTEGLQNFSTGMQLRNALNTAQVPYVASTAIITDDAIRVAFIANTR